MSSSDSGGLFAGVFWLGIVGIGISYAGLGQIVWLTKLWYSTTYKIPYESVSVDKRPTDCDFLTAPLGRKDCTYKGLVRVFNSEGYQIAGDDAPRFSRDVNSKRPIVSYDEGKTWRWLAGEALPNRGAHHAEYSWVRERD